VHHMVEPTAEARLAGMQMLKAYFEGPQDLSLTDGANELGKKVWEGFGGSTGWLQCFEWTRVLRPGSYALRGLGNRIQQIRPLTEAARPLGWVADSLLPRYFQPRATASTGTPLDAASLLPLFRQVTSRVALKPDYDDRSLAWLLSRAAGITSGGQIQQVAVHGANGKPIGWYLYYLSPGTIGEVLQIAAERGSMSAVLDHLFMHAAEHGAAALTGRVEPPLMDALGEHGRKVNFRVAPYSKVLIRSRHPEVLEAIYQGDAFMTRLEGEWCTSFRM
jgi:hypothetical protein